MQTKSFHRPRIGALPFFISAFLISPFFFDILLVYYIINQTTLYFCIWVGFILALLRGSPQFSTRFHNGSCICQPCKNNSCTLDQETKGSKYPLTSSLCHRSPTWLLSNQLEVLRHVSSNIHSCYVPITAQFAMIRSGFDLIICIDFFTLSVQEQGL